MNKRTTNGHFSLNFLGHVQTEQEVARNFEELDAKLGPTSEDPTIIIVAPTPTTDDIGKVLGVVDDGEGNPVIGWVAGA